MSEEIYRQLARYLDDLPAGYPATESGVELRILRRLFTPAEAELALKLTVLPEEARVVARRAGRPVAEIAEQLEKMEQRGLLYSQHPPDGPPRYSVAPFAIGVWEFQVNRLTPGLIRDFEEYAPHLLEIWEKTPQLRAIPVGEAIPTDTRVMAYEQAEEIVRSHDQFTVAPCICRRERAMVGEGCDKPLEVCLSFGSAAAFYRRNGLGRPITQEEALQILKTANEAGLVLQPGNAQKATFICCCCGDCCAVLRNLQRHPQPAAVIGAAFLAVVDADKCVNCGLCEFRCQVNALDLSDFTPQVRRERCIGCGLCVSTCPGHALSLVRKAKEEQLPIPRTNVMTHLQLGRARGKLKVGELIRLVIRSQADRLLA